MNTYQNHRNALTGPLTRPEPMYAMHSVWRPLASPEAGGRGQLLNQPEERAMKRHNPVAKHARSFNKSAVHRDRKKDDRRGYQKHRGRPGEGGQPAQIDQMEKIWRNAFKKSA